MADSDQSSYITRFDVLSQGMQYFVGSTWYDVPTSGGGTPGSPTNSLQFNDSGSFAGSAGLLFDGTTTITLNLTGTITAQPVTLPIEGAGPISELLIQSGTTDMVGAHVRINTNQDDGTSHDSMFDEYGALVIGPYYQAGKPCLTLTPNQFDLVDDGGTTTSQVNMSPNVILVTDMADNNSQRAMLALNSVTRYFLPPRMTTTQRDAIDVSSGSPEGATIYNTTTHTLNFYNGSAWTAV